MKSLSIAVFLFYSVNGFSQNIIDSTVSIQEYMDSFGANMKKLIGKEMNNFSLASTKGIIYTKDSLKGKVTLINFWFEGCLPCVAEFPDLNRLYEKFKGNKNFQLLAFTFDPLESIKKVKEKYKLEYELLCANESKIQELNFSYGFPTNLVIDQNGKIAYYLIGNPFETTKPDFNFNMTLIPKITKLLLQK
jgi:peroxiredoxin